MAVSSGEPQKNLISEGSDIQNFWPRDKRVGNDSGQHSAPFTHQQTVAKRLLENCSHAQCPSWSDLGLGVDDPSHYPAHIKDVPPNAGAGILDLPPSSSDPNSLARRNFRKALCFIHDIPVGIEKGRAIDAKLAQHEIERMLAVSQLEETHFENVKSNVHVFTTVEHMKKRRRVLKHTKSFNDLFGRATLLGIKLTNVANLVRSVHDGTFSIEFDFSAWFDQFLIAEGVRPFFCFPAHGRWFRLTRLPMGMRQANDIAHSATEVILDFDMPVGVKATSYVDNVRFLGHNLQDVIAAAAEFIRRCHAVSATINDITTTSDLEAAKAIAANLAHSQGEFLGVEFDYLNHRVAVGQKAISKAQQLLGQLRKHLADPKQNFTNQNMLATFGILLFALQITKNLPASHYYALQAYSELARLVQRDPHCLNNTYHCSPSKMQHILQWLVEVAHPTEASRWHVVPKVPPPDDTDFTLVTDASKVGWGAILINRFGRVRVAFGSWDNFGGRRRSAWSEPEAIARALIHFFPHGTAHSITVLTDSSTAQGAFQRGRSGCYIVNRSLLSVQQTSPTWNIQFHHIDGSHNPADPVSRGKGLGLSDEAVTAQIRRLVLGLSRDRGPN